VAAVNFLYKIFLWWKYRWFRNR